MFIAVGFLIGENLYESFIAAEKTGAVFFKCFLRFHSPSVAHFRLESIVLGWLGKTLIIVMARDTTELPFVSIGFPTRNRAHCLVQSLGSLLKQSHRNIEIIVSDNCSTDDTEAKVRTLAALDFRVRYIRQQNNIGGIANHEFVLKQAHGKYFMWASDDDYWMPDFVEKLVFLLEANKQYDVAMSHYYIRFLKDGTEVGRELRKHDFTWMSHQELFRYHFRGRKTPILFFGLYRTEFLKAILARPTPISYQGPHLFLCEVSLSGRAMSLSEPLHVRTQNTSSRIARHPTHPFALAEQKTFAMTHHMIKSFFWLLASPVIPFSRKILIFQPWFARLWKKKKKFLSEFKKFLRQLF